MSRGRTVLSLATRRVRRVVRTLSRGGASAGSVGLDPNEQLARIDVSRHNRGGSPPTFDRLVSQVVSASQFAHPDFIRWQTLLYPDAGSKCHRKRWEHCYLMRAAEQHGVLRSGNRALGFGVGVEPIPAALARHGIDVLATDLEPGAATAAVWSATGQHMSGLASLSFPHIVDDVELSRRVRTQCVDMIAIPSTLGRFHLVWSSGSFEHLGSPDSGFDFVLNTLDLLEPRGVSIHTTELELVPHDETRDYGHLAVYRPDDLDRLVDRIRGRGFEIETNWTVSLETPADRFVSLPPFSFEDEELHLKPVVGDSIATSVGIIVRKPGDSR